MLLFASLVLIILISCKNRHGDGEGPYIENSYFLEFVNFLRSIEFFRYYLFPFSSSLIFLVSFDEVELGNFLLNVKNIPVEKLKKYQALQSIFLQLYCGVSELTRLNIILNNDDLLSKINKINTKANKSYENLFSSNIAFSKRPMNIKSSNPNSNPREAVSVRIYFQL